MKSKFLRITHSKLKKDTSNSIATVQNDDLKKFNNIKQIMDQTYNVLSIFSKEKGKEFKFLDVINILKTIENYSKNKELLNNDMKKFNDIKNSFKTDFISLINFYNLKKKYDEAKKQMKIKFKEKNIQEKINAKFNPIFQKITDTFITSMKNTAKTIDNANKNYGYIVTAIEEFKKDQKNIMTLTIGGLSIFSIFEELFKSKAIIADFKIILKDTSDNLEKEFKNYQNNDYLSKIMIFLFIIKLL